ncbi:MAG: iron uptake porin [Trichormus sp. ATA11-4-KO1]|jgi:hypothetical protein|nr:iron uptake porin [Trichormus sp. ATA11-4-KO1]
MSSVFRLGSVILAVILVLTEKAFAVTEQQNSSLTQMTSFSQLADIKSTDWEFTALQSLVKRYDCKADFSHYGGQRFITRSEFAISLNLCLTSINQLIAASRNHLVNQGDLSTLRRLQTEFAFELNSLQARVDNLEEQTTQLQAQQFSASTNFSGEVIIAIAGFVGTNKADDRDEPINNNIFLGNRVRMTFDTSFTGQDRLRVRLQARNTPAIDRVTGTAMTRLGFDGDSNNDIDISRLEYRFPIGKQAIGFIQATAGELNDFADPLNPFFINSGSGAISRFGRRNPIYRQGFGTGVGIDYELSDVVNLSVGYISDRANDPEVGIGASPYGAIAQLTLEPIENAEIGLTYVRSYNNINTATGSELANDPFDNDSDRITANSYGVQGSWRLNRHFYLGGWVGLTQATAEDLSGKPTADIFNYAVTLAFPDISQEGDLAGIILGQPPKVISNELGRKLTDEANSWHLEVFYRFPVNENIAITPGLLVITNPEHKYNNDTIYIGTVRTTLFF